MLKSHYEPSLTLQEHIARVLTAGRSLSQETTPRTLPFGQWLEQMLPHGVRCHDAGKASPAFQSYIKAPDHYQGDPRAKEHSVLSTVCFLLWARAQGWTPLEALPATLSIAGHHRGMLTLEALEGRLLLDPEDPLSIQLEALDLQTLSEETGISPPLSPGKSREARRWLFSGAQAIKKTVRNLSVDEGMTLRLKTQALLSILLEADKAFLALGEDSFHPYLSRSPSLLPPSLVSNRLEGLPDSPLNTLRDAIRQAVSSRLKEAGPRCTLTLPTGTGKTLMAATWALETRARLQAQIPDGPPPRVVIALPFLSIIDQTHQEYRTLLKPLLSSDTGSAPSELLMPSHSLSDRTYELEGVGLRQKYADFFLDTWRSEVIITTFDQLLMALFEPSAKTQMRFHGLLDALIILDEVQSLPCRLWHLVDAGLQALTRLGRSQVLLMSATQPALLSNASELAGSPEEVRSIFGHFNRYRITLEHGSRVPLETFQKSATREALVWLDQGLRGLFTLNTRASARAVHAAVSEAVGQRLPVHLISADVTPRDRLEKIRRIRSGEPCVVVSTQTVEAGVDIDLDCVVRDLAPLDAVIQVAGRCNRHGRRGDLGGAVKLVCVTRSGDRPLAEAIYDPILLQATLEVLEGRKTVAEEEVLQLSTHYFALLKERMNTGEAYRDAFVRLEDFPALPGKSPPSIHSLLRGEERKQISFLVADDEEGLALQDEFSMTLELKDRWEKRSRLRAMAHRIEERSVSVYARADLRPEDFARPLGPLWVLREGFYSSETGLQLKKVGEDPVWVL